jgi:hypothetical protein
MSQKDRNARIINPTSPPMTLPAMTRTFWLPLSAAVPFAEVLTVAEGFTNTVVWPPMVSTCTVVECLTEEVEVTRADVLLVLLVE